jgi:hypothetical protein
MNKEEIKIPIPLEIEDDNIKEKIESNDIVIK